MIYLDNAATSYPKPECVIRDLNFCLRKSSGNPGRSSHTLSLRASEAVYDCRETIADFFNFPYPEQVVFSYNATYCLNMAIKGLIKEKCHIITSDYEHNSVIRPLEALKKSLGIEYSTISPINPYESLNSALRPDTRAIVISLASNLTGDEFPLSVLSGFAKENSLILIVDASQAAGHKNIDLSKTPCDAFCAPGHKALFGIQGCGFGIYKDKNTAKSLIEGGSGSESTDVNMPKLLPEGYEAGTLGVPAIVSLGSGINYINKVGLDQIRKKLWALTDRTEEMLKEFKCVSVYKKGCGIIAFNIGNLPSSYASSRLDKMGICVRGGLHCAPSVHKKLSTEKQGAIRVSYSFLNKLSDADRLYSAIKSIIKSEE